MPLYWVAAKAGLPFFVSFGQEQDHATSKNIMLLVNWVKYLVYSVTNRESYLIINVDALTKTATTMIRSWRKLSARGLRWKRVQPSKTMKKKANQW